VADLPGPADMPSPWLTWALFAVCEYGRLQRWALGALEALVVPRLRARSGTPTHLEDLDARGFLPGLPEWEYDVEPGQATVAHRADREIIDLDTSRGPGVFCDWMFVEALLSHRRPGPTTLRLLQLHPDLLTLPMALEDLSRAGLLHVNISDDYNLSVRARALLGPIGAFLAAWRDRPGWRVWLAALIGDWQAAHEAARRGDDPDLTALTGRRAERCRRDRLGRLRRHIAARGPSVEALGGLAAAGAEDLPRHLRRALRRPGDLATFALELIADDAAYLDEAGRLFGLSLGRAGSEAGLDAACVAAYLARHGGDPRPVIAALSERAREPAEAALLALEHAPETAPPLLRRALRSGRRERLTAAAVLALVDRPWSRRELVGALGDPRLAGRTAACRAALRESGDPEARRVADVWEADRASREGGGPRTSGGPGRGEVRIGRELGREMDRLRERVLGLRDRLPPHGAAEEGPSEGAGDSRIGPDPRAPSR
jgi:hypothetical protein